jgi:hypothetical protein
MKVYTYSEARQRLAALLEQASREGAVRIRKRDGSTYVLRPESTGGSPLDVDGVDLEVGIEEILTSIREGRRPLQ